MMQDRQTAHTTSRKAAAIGPACRRAFVCMLAVAVLAGLSTALSATTVEVANFGSNPGNLRMFKHVPDELPSPTPLVVVMHGCKQNARDYASDSGWIALADKLRFALVMPEQNPANNQNSCFNWFQPGDARRDRGEALSIKQMIDKMKADHPVDAGRVFATGLSAGGAMTSAMLATYPEVFSAGGIVAGLPYGCAENLPDALQCMNSGHPAALPGGRLPGARVFPAGASGSLFAPGWCLFFPLLCVAPPGGDGLTPEEWGDRVRAASPHPGPFPRVSIWHGGSDATVNPVNAVAEMKQWANLHGLDPDAAAHDSVKGFPREVLKDPHGRPVVEKYTITGMLHGTPVDPGPGEDQCGAAAPFVIDVNICSSRFIARFWGLAD